MFLDLKPRRKLLTSALFTAIASFAFSAATVQAQSAYPNKPVKMVVAFAPGTASDIIGRLVAEKLSQSMGQSFVVENRAGAGGTIAAEAVAKSPADGYTLLVSTAALPVSASVYPSLKYDTAKDFASITVLTHSPLLLAAHLDCTQVHCRARDLRQGESRED